MRWDEIVSFLNQQSTLTLATVSEEGLACVAPLFYLLEAEKEAESPLTFYWLSSPSSQHSRNLRLEQRAALSIQVQTERWREIRGLQMRGTVEVVRDRERRRTVIERYSERFQLGAVLRVAIARSTLYAFRPELVRWIDNSKRLGKRVEWNMKQS
jgi:hypothetical protein